MPIKVPNDLPAIDTLTKENVFVMTDTRAMTQNIRPLRILLLNLMPTKIETETQLTRLLGNSPLQVEMELLQTSTHEAHNVSQEHMLAFYKTFDQVRDNYYDGMIITGAPIELMEFEEVDYWDELCEIMEWTKSHVHSTFHICWGAQAGLYYHYGIKKHVLPEKLSGVFLHHLDYRNGMLFRGFDDEFYVPHSRNTTVYREDIEAVPQLKIIASSDKAGVFCVKSDDDRQIFVMGHSEYDWNTLLKEYERDKKAGLHPHVPDNYFPGDDDTKQPVVRWRSCANLLYSNWLNYFVYQSTPYDLNAIATEELAEVKRPETNLTVLKFGGSSVANAGQFRKVKDIVTSDAARRYVIVSAPGRREKGDTKVTDILIGSTGSAKKFGESMEQVRQRFGQIIHTLDIDFDIRGEVEEISRKYRSGSAGGLYIVSRGEYLCARVMAKYLGYDFVDSADLIVFGYDGKLNEEETRKRIRETLAKHERAVIPGFYGAYENGVIQTFSRGGSDITGALVAEAVEADLYENWTDVSGLLMADPGVVKHPLSVPVITYKELRELSMAGAQVLHEDTVAPVRRIGIPVNIRNTNDPEAPGTMIVPSADHYPAVLDISGVSGKKGYAALLIDKEKLGMDPAFRLACGKLFAKYKLRMISEQVNPDSVSIIVEEKALRRCGRDLAEELKDAAETDNVVLDVGIAMIGVVGRNINRTPHVAVRIFESLSAEQINVRFVDHASYRIAITLGVDEADMDRAIRAIYRAFTQQVLTA